MPEPGSVASFVPSGPVRVLVLAHGFPWADGSQPDSFLAEYAQAAVERWTAFAEAHHAIVIAPAFGGSEFGGYRALFGRKIDADEFVNSVVNQVAGEHIPSFNGRFTLHGHAAGAQFAARYLVTHPERLEEVILSAPGAYPFPDPALPWPAGMAAVVRDQLSGSRADGKAPDQAAGAVFIPRPAGWLEASSAVCVSALDQGSGARPGSSGQPHGSTACTAMPRPVTGRLRSDSFRRKDSTTTKRLWPYPLKKYWHEGGLLARKASLTLKRQTGTTDGAACTSPSDMVTGPV